MFFRCPKKTEARRLYRDEQRAKGAHDWAWTHRGTRRRTAVTSCFAGPVWVLRNPENWPLLRAEDGAL